jgi:hypothetical protein
MRAVTLTMGCALIVAVLTSPFWLEEVVGSIANQVLADARPPQDRELPPTAYGISYSSADIQTVGGQGRELSCSIPWLVENVIFQRRQGFASISLRMRQACVFHDYCYRHGAATYGYSQADCDYMILDHAYRICRYINLLGGVERCARDARKVLLGVRWGGSDSFKRSDGIPNGLGGAAIKNCPMANSKSEAAEGVAPFDDRCASSYFEFNPNPSRAQRYSVYRIADAPDNWVSAGLRRKALYAFEMRPSGSRVTVVGWSEDQRVAACIGYELPGAFDFLNSPPQIARSGPSAGTAAEDWFVWWRRIDLEHVRGKIAVLAPGRAGFLEWLRLFPGSREFNPDGCNSMPAVAPSINEAKPASNIILISDKKITPAPTQQASSSTSQTEIDTANFSELHPAPGFEASSKIRMVALRTHTCLNQATNILCYHDFLIDPAGPYYQYQEPYVVRDFINVQPEAFAKDRSVAHENIDARFNPKYDGSEPDRYRNFVTPPIVLAAPTQRLGKSDKGDSSPVLSWLRRGGTSGEGYKDSGFLRRAHRGGDNGEVGLGYEIIRLLGFEEKADPVFVLGRTTEEPRLLSLGIEPEHSGTISMRQWSFPKKFEPVDEGCWQRNTKSRNFLIACSQASVLPEFVGEDCMKHIDESWIARRPVVDATTRGNGSAVIMFNRIVTRSSAAGVIVELQARFATVKPHDCAMSAMTAYRLATEGLQKKPESPEELAAYTARIRALRASPVLLADMNDDGRYDLVLPNSQEFGKSTLLQVH